MLPGGRYTSTGSVVAVHILVGHKNRVYACVVAADAPSYVSFGLLEEVRAANFRLSRSGVSCAAVCHHCLFIAPRTRKRAHCTSCPYRSPSRVGRKPYTFPCTVAETQAIRLSVRSADRVVDMAHATSMARSHRSEKISNHSTSASFSARVFRGHAVADIAILLRDTKVQIQYLFNVSGIAFSTKENAHNKRCQAELWKSWKKYEAIQAALAQERETR